ncbi:MAG: PilX N-terminal domain-containing pilus assembly protein [Sedimenticola sp.]
MRDDLYIQTAPRQSGVVLVVVLVFLFILTLLGITGARNTVLEERMAGNYRDSQIAFEAAETALREAENALLNDTAFNAMAWSGTNGTHEGNPSLDPFGTNNSVTVTISEITAATSQNPSYYIERLPEVYMPSSSLVRGFPEQPPKIRYYRSTASGWGQSPNAEVVLQSTLYR